MRQWVLVILLSLLALFFLIGLIAYFAYGISEAPPSRAEIAGLERPAQVTWHDDGSVTLEASSPADRLAALGFAHGAGARWTVALWRQTALGRLGEWFGPDALPLDRVARSLGFARNALRSYERLDPEERALLAAYTRGMNVALSKRDGAPREFASLGIDAEQWEPWHTLAIERLFAWMSTRLPPRDSLQAPGAALEGFLSHERMLRDFLHLGGFDFGTAWTVRDSAAVMLVQRQVTGASALPVLFEVDASSDSLDRVVGATIPGTPFFLAGRTASRAWSLIPSSPVAFRRIRIDSARVDTLYDRIVLDRADETLHRTPVYGDGLAFQAYDFSPALDTTARDEREADTLASSLADFESARNPFIWHLSWPGLEVGSDLQGWLALQQDGSGTFRMLDGAGLALNRSGDAQVMGTPRFVMSYGSGLLVSQQELTRFIAGRLDSIGVQESEVDVAPPYLDDCRSSWAAEHAPRLVGLIDQTFRHQRFMEEALTYLRNWDFSYDRSSIAASIFDSWVSAYVDSTGSFPDRTVVDTAYARQFELYSVLIAALNELARVHGRDMSQWRWEVRMPHRFYFPVWSQEDLTEVQSGVLSETRYAPIEIAGNGHPTTPCWGPSPIQRERPYPAAWESWVSTSSWDDYRIRRRRLDRDAFLARYRISDAPPQPIVMARGSSRGRVTRLYPVE